MFISLCVCVRFEEKQDERAITGERVYFLFFFTVRSYGNDDHSLKATIRERPEISSEIFERLIKPVKK